MDPKKLRTVANYAKTYRRKNGKPGVTRAMIYQLIREGKLKPVEIDGVQFIELDEPKQVKTKRR